MQNAYPVRRVKRAPLASTSLAERGATITIRNAAGRMATPASKVE